MNGFDSSASPASAHHAARLLGANLTRVTIPEPIIGGKGLCLEGLGNFLLEEGPGVLRAIAITHTGSSYLTIYDGLDVTSSSRPLFRANPTVLGHFMCDVGFNNGLTVEVGGKMMPFVTIVWIKHRSAPNA